MKATTILIRKAYLALEENKRAIFDSVTFEKQKELEALIEELEEACDN